MCPSSLEALRLVTLRLGQRFAFRLRADHIADLVQHLSAQRERIAIIIDDPAKLLFENGSLFIIWETVGVTNGGG